MELPVHGETAEPGALLALSRAAEGAGIAMLGFTDHPAPSAKWLAGGGHPTFDPFAALSFVAAATTRVGLMTYLAVLPYRDPLALAKSVATVDRLSGGRFTLVAGTGYLRSEFAALGRSMDDRNERFDEAVDVLRAAFVDDDYRREGAGFRAVGVIQEPKPVQLPHPPIWIGGASRASRERVARFGAGWAPLLTDARFAQTVRTASMSSLEQLGRAIEDLRERLVAHGREPGAVAVHLDGVGTIDDPPDLVLDRGEELATLGVTHLLVRPPKASVGTMVEAIERFGVEVIARS